MLYSLKLDDKVLKNSKEVRSLKESLKYFKVLSQYFSGKTQNCHKSLSEYNWSPKRGVNQVSVEQPWLLKLWYALLFTGTQPY